MTHGRKAILTLLVGLFAATLLFSLAGEASPVEGQHDERTHPAVDAFIERHPGTLVPVIVRMKGPLGNPNVIPGLADARRLDIVNGVAARVSAADIERLGKHSSVDFISLDVPMVSEVRQEETGEAAFRSAVGAEEVWAKGITGEDITVAVIDSGLTAGRELADRVDGRYDLSSVAEGVRDENGHGTFVSGLIAGKDDRFSGIAPEARVLSLRVSDGQGQALASDVIAALQWVVNHKDEFRIRVVNISLNSATADSYRQDPISAAVEQAWFHGIVVVVSAGNFGNDALSVDHAPANDPYAITVGAFDDRGTATISDDHLPAWSSRGTTADGYAKPELVAPGANIVSTLAPGSTLAAANGARGPSQYTRLSGTSAAAAIVSGAVALMLDAEPSLTPEEVKYRLVRSGTRIGGSAAPRVDVASAISTAATGTANENAQPNELINADTGEIMYDSVLWRSVLWRSVLWRSLDVSVLWRN